MTVVYHGGEVFSSPIRPPFFVTQDRNVAQSYADETERAGKSSALMCFEMRPCRTASEDIIDGIAEQLGIYDDTRMSFEYVSPAIEPQAEIVIRELLELGYHAAVLSDFGFQNSFTEVESIVVFDPTILQPIQLNEKAGEVYCNIEYTGHWGYIEVQFNPSRGDMCRMARQGSFLRGIVLRDKWLVWDASVAIHDTVLSGLERADEFDEEDSPYEYAFYVEVEAPNDIVFIGNPDFCSRFISDFGRRFDRIEIPGDEDEEYQMSQWGIPIRFSRYASERVG